VVALIPLENEIEVLFDEAFPSGTNLGGRCSGLRGKSFQLCTSSEQAQGIGCHRAGL
jgi:hypothetical protein